MFLTNKNNKEMKHFEIRRWIW